MFVVVVVWLGQGLGYSVVVVVVLQGLGLGYNECTHRGTETLADCKAVSING